MKPGYKPSFPDVQLMGEDRVPTLKEFAEPLDRKRLHDAVDDMFEVIAFIDEAYTVGIFDKNDINQGRYYPVIQSILKKVMLINY